MADVNDSVNVSEDTVNITAEQLLMDNFGPRFSSLGTLVSLIIVYLIIFISGVVGNVCTCIVIVKNRYMHTATNYYLFSLAISDMLTLILGKSIYCR